MFHMIRYKNSKNKHMASVSWKFICIKTYYGTTGRALYSKFSMDLDFNLE